MGKRKATRSEIIERNRKIVKDYEDGLSFEQLSEKYGLCVRTCYRALDEEQQAQRIAEEQGHANLVDKIVAEYQKNIGMVFDYARKSPCVLCLDEIDAIGTRRGGKDDVAEMNRVTIALMQELDRLGNEIILIGTTNRPDTLDDALFRRFTFGHTVRPLCRDDARTLARMFFASVGYSASDAEIESQLDDTSQYYTASKITNLCIDHIIDWVANQEDTPCIGKV